MSATDELEQRREREARNQSLFREVNERIAELQPPSSFIEFVCECSREHCGQPVSLTLQEYEEIRAHPNRFLVLAGHQLPEVEEVVASHDRYLVVAKSGAGAAVAHQLDTRHRQSNT